MNPLEAFYIGISVGIVFASVLWAIVLNDAEKLWRGKK